MKELTTSVLILVFNQSQGLVYFQVERLVECFGRITNLC